MISIDLNLVWTIINLVVLYLLLRHFLFKPVMNIMEQRKQMIADGLQNAQNVQDEAMKMKQGYEEALSGAKEESVRIIEKAQREAKTEYERILKEADVKAGGMIESAKETIRIEREQTMNELQSQIAGLAMSAAEKIVGEKTENQGNQGIYDRFLKEVGDAHEDTDNE